MPRVKPDEPHLFIEKRYSVADVVRITGWSEKQIRDMHRAGLLVGEQIRKHGKIRFTETALRDTFPAYFPDPEK